MLGIFNQLPDEILNEIYRLVYQDSVKNIGLSTYPINGPRIKTKEGIDICVKREYWSRYDRGCVGSPELNEFYMKWGSIVSRLKRAQLIVFDNLLTACELDKNTWAI